MARRQLGQLDTPAGEKRSLPTKSASGRSREKSRECRIDFAGVAGVEDLYLQPHGAGSRFDVPIVASRWRHWPD